MKAQTRLQKTRPCWLSRIRRALQVGLLSGLCALLPLAPSVANVAAAAAVQHSNLLAATTETAHTNAILTNNEQTAVSNGNQNHPPSDLDNSLTMAQQQFDYSLARQRDLESTVNKLSQTSNNPTLVTNNTDLSKTSDLWNTLSLQTTSAQAMADSLKIALANLQEAQQVAHDQLTQITEHLSPAADTSLAIHSNLNQESSSMQRLAQQQHLEKLLILYQNRATCLKKSIALANQQLTILKSWQTQLQRQRQQQKIQQQQQQYQRRLLSLELSQTQWYQQLEEIHKTLTTPLDSGTSDNTEKSATTDKPDPSQLLTTTNLEFQTFLLEEKIANNQLEQLLIRLTTQVQQLKALPEGENRIGQLDEERQQAQTLIFKFSQLSQLVADKLNFITLQKQLWQNKWHTGALEYLHYKHHADEIDQLLKTYSAQQKQIQQQHQALQVLQRQLDQTLKHELSIRQTLPGFSMHGWHELFLKVAVIPQLLWQSLTNSFEKIYAMVHHEMRWTLLLLLLPMIACAIGGRCLHNYLKKLINRFDAKSLTFSRQVLHTILQLIKRSLLSLCISAWLIWFVSEGKENLNIWWPIIAVILTTQFALTLARIFLVETAQDEGGADVRLYGGLKWLLIGGGVIIASMLLSYQLPVSYEVQILFNRIFMVLLLGVSILLFQGRKVLPKLIKEFFNVSKPYLNQAAKLLCWLAPVTLASTAVIGIIGFVELAWTISFYQLMFCLVMAGYLVVRGFLVEFMEFNYALLIRHVSNGWLWTQAILKPIDQALKILLVLGAVYAFFKLNGFTENPQFSNHLHNFLTAPLLSFGSQPGSKKAITIWMLVQLGLAGCLIAWLAKWTREFSFRWVYSRTRDIGVRNSLAVFTQYSAVIIGALIGLRMMGIDLSSLAVVAAAFAAGIGFGLRDLANNFFSGLLLLVERPFRAGDTITIGTYEGEVMSTGLRSLKIRTWDHMELIVPNADLFSKPFINWTLQDNIIRSVIRITINREDNPQKVQQLLLQVLQKLKCVAEDPAPEVFLKELDSSLIELEVRFFLNIEIHKSRPKIRSEVLFAIWECFQQHDIRAPHPQYEIKLDRLNSSADLSSTQSSALVEMADGPELH